MLSSLTKGGIVDVFFWTRHGKRRVVCLLRGHAWSEWAHHCDGKFYRFCFRCEVAEVIGYTVGKMRIE